MKTNGRIEHVKTVGKQMKKACPVEIGLAHTRTALARALGFANWYALTQSLPPEFSAEFQTKALKISMDPSDSTFLAAVQRFAESSGVEHAIAHALCVKFLPSALEKWHSWKDRTPEMSDRPKIGSEASGEPPAPCDSTDGSAATQPLLAATVSHAGVRLITQRQPAPVVVRKKRCSST